MSNEDILSEVPVAGDLFKSYQLTPEVIASGYTFTSANKAVIQNLISAYAHDHMQLTFDPAAPELVAIQQATIRGAIDALSYLLSADESLTKR